MLNLPVPTELVDWFYKRENPCTACRTGICIFKVIERLFL